MAIYSASLPVSVSAPAGANIFYLSPDGDNSNGTSLATAWRDWGDVVWASVTPGSFIYVSPGLYLDQLRPTVDGTAGNPITILGVGTSAATPAIFQGGRGTSLLPQSGESGWTAESATENGIWIDKDYITIDGGTLFGFQVRGWIGHGCRIQNGSDGCILRNLEMYNNGWVTLGTGWDGDTYGTDIAITNGNAIRLGSSSLIERCVLHDNGQDGIQSLFAPNSISDSVIRQCWMYNARKHTIATGSPPGGPGTKSFNWGTHTDAIQIYDGGTVDGPLFERCHFGPGLTNSIIMGDVSTSTVVINLTLIDCTFDRPSTNAVFANSGTAGAGWDLNRITIVATNSTEHAIYTEGNTWTISNTLVESVPSGADIDLNGTGYTFSGNYYRDVTLNSGTSGFGTSLSTTLFPLANLVDNFVLNDYTPDVSGGSAYHTVPEYLGLDTNTITGPNEFGQYFFTTVTTGGGGGGETGGGTTPPVIDLYTYPLNTAFVRVVRPVKDVISRVRVSMRDEDNQRWSDAEMYNAINRSLDTWANRVYMQCVYDLPIDLNWSQIEYQIPYYIREPMILQRKIERWYWTGTAQDERWSDVQGAYVIPDGKGGQQIYVDVDTSWLQQEDARIIWHAEVGHVPPFDVFLATELGAEDSTLTISNTIIDTIGDVGYVIIDQELIQYSGVTETPTTTTLHGLLRACNNTARVTHASGVEVQWGIPYVDNALYNVLQTQVRSYLQYYYMTDSSAKETEHYQWTMRWEQQNADDFWKTWLPNRKPQISLSRQAIYSPEY